MEELSNQEFSGLSTRKIHIYPQLCVKSVFNSHLFLLTHPLRLHFSPKITFFPGGIDKRLGRTSISEACHRKQRADTNNEAGKEQRADTDNEGKRQEPKTYPGYHQ